MLYERGRVGGGWLKWLYAAVFAACVVGCGDDEWDGAPAGETSGVLRKQGSPIRLRAPLSGSVSASRQPVFAFTPARDARVDICYDRACDHVLESLAGRDGEAQPETPLPAGTLFWRAVTHKQASATWQLVIPSRESGLTTVSATVPDYNGDGLADVAIGAPAVGTGSVPIMFGRFFPVPTLDVDADGGRCVRPGDRGGGRSERRRLRRPGGGVGQRRPGIGDDLQRRRRRPDHGRHVAARAGDGGLRNDDGERGDVNGDGYGDLLVGGREVAQVFFGGPSCVSAGAALVLAGAPGGDATIVQGRAT